MNQITEVFNHARKYIPAEILADIIEERKGEYYYTQRMIEKNVSIDTVLEHVRVSTGNKYYFLIYALHILLICVGSLLVFSDKVIWSPFNVALTVILLGAIGSKLLWYIGTKELDNKRTAVYAVFALFDSWYMSFSKANIEKELTGVIQEYNVLADEALKLKAFYQDICTITYHHKRDLYEWHLNRVNIDGKHLDIENIEFPVLSDVKQ